MCTHDLVEVLSTNGRNLDGAVRRCVECGEDPTKRQAIRKVSASVLTTGPQLPTAVKQCFAALRPLRVENVGGEWSVAQHCKRNA